MALPTKSNTSGPTTIVYAPFPYWDNRGRIKNSFCVPATASGPVNATPPPGPSNVTSASVNCSGSMGSSNVIRMNGPFGFTALSDAERPTTLAPWENPLTNSRVVGESSGEITALPPKSKPS